MAISTEAVGKRYEQTLYLFRKKDGKLESEALLPTLFVPMTGKAEDVRKEKPDPLNPSLANGSFEEKAFPSGAQPGWYYERLVQEFEQSEHLEEARKRIVEIKAALAPKL